MTVTIGFETNSMLPDTAKTGGITRIERRRAKGEGEGFLYIVVGYLLPVTRRRNMQGSSRFFQRNELGLNNDWELAHLWAPRFGDETAAGIMWAPKQMNQDFQNHKVEPWLERLRDNAPVRSIEITASAVSWDNQYLKQFFNWPTMKGVEFLKKSYL